MLQGAKVQPIAVSSSLLDGKSVVSRKEGAWRTFIRFIKFCIVGGSGVFVDMGVLYLLADPSRLGLNITLSKIIAAETAMINNFIWNELWTFRSHASSFDASPSSGGEGWGEGEPIIGHDLDRGEGRGEVKRLSLNPQPSSLNRRGSVFGRFLLFNAICGIGIGLAVLLLHLFHTWLGWNLYLSNLAVIVLITFWNFGMNTRFNWSYTQR